MVEEIKMILDAIKEVPEFSLWVLAGFALYKTVMHLSTAGAVVFVLKLLIEKVWDVAKKPPKKEIEYSLLANPINEEVGARIDGLLRRVKCRVGGSSDYWHDRHADWLMSAIELKIQKEEEE